MKSGIDPNQNKLALPNCHGNGAVTVAMIEDDPHCCAHGKIMEIQPARRKTWVKKTTEILMSTTCRPKAGLGKRCKVVMSTLNPGRMNRKRQPKKTGRSSASRGRAFTGRAAAHAGRNGKHAKAIGA